MGHEDEGAGQWAAVDGPHSFSMGGTNGSFEWWGRDKSSNLLPRIEIYKIFETHQVNEPLSLLKTWTPFRSIPLLEQQWGEMPTHCVVRTTLCS